MLGNSRGDYTDPVALPLGSEVTVVNLNGQSPTVDTGDIHGPLTSAQVGLFNHTLNPSSPLSVTWYVDGKKVVETNNTAVTALNPNFNATFELKQSVWVMFGQQAVTTKTYTAQTFGEMVEIQIPNGATDVYILAYTGTDGDTFKAVSASAFRAIVQAAQAHKQELRAAQGQNAVGAPQQMSIGNIHFNPPAGGPGFVGAGHASVDTISGQIHNVACNFGADGIPAVGVLYNITFTYTSGPWNGHPAAVNLTCSDNSAMAYFR